MQRTLVALLVALHEQEPPQLWAWQLHRLLRVAWRMVKKARSQGLTALPQPTQLRIQRLFDRIIAPAHQQHPHAQRQQGQRGRVAQSDARNLLDRLITYKDAYLRFLTNFAVPLTTISQNGHSHGQITAENRFLSHRTAALISSVASGATSPLCANSTMISSLLLPRFGLFRPFLLFPPAE
ncbi:MAG: transposase [Caldilineaceae bacterium]